MFGPLSLRRARHWQRAVVVALLQLLPEPRPPSLSDLAVWSPSPADDWGPLCAEAWPNPVRPIPTRARPAAPNEEASPK